MTHRPVNVRTPPLARALGLQNSRENKIAEPLEPPTAQVLSELTYISGINGDDSIILLVLLMRWHIDRGPRPFLDDFRMTFASAHDRYVQETIRRRAWELIDTNRHRLPPVNEATAP